MVNWLTKKLEEICDFISGNQNINKSKATTNGKYPAYSASGQDIFLDTYEHEGSAIIVSWIGARCGKCFLAEGRWTAIANTQILKIKNEDECDYKYLFYFLNDEKKWPRVGGAQPYISKPRAKKIEVPLPPLHIQKRIVARIEEFFEKIDKVKELRKKVQEETEQIFSLALEKVFREGEKKYKKRKLEEVLELNQSGIWGEKPINPENSYPVIRSTEITHTGELNLDSVAIREIKPDKVDKYSLANGDILIVKSSGSVNLIGRCAIFKNPSNKKKFLFSNFIQRFRPNKKLIVPKFLYYFLNSEGKKFVRYLMTTTTGLRNLPIKQYVKLKIPLPPLSEQKRIVVYLDNLREKVEKLKKLQEEQLKDLEELKKSILEKAFKGELL